MEHLLLLCLLFFLSLQTQARESHFFSKASRSKSSITPIAEEPSATVLPPQSRNGYGLYGDLRYQSRPTTTTNNFPSTVANTEYSKEQSNLDPTTIPSTFSSEFSNHELPSESYENNREPTNANTIPSTLSNEEYFSYENKEPSYSYNKEYGMSDTRILDNGKYFYDLNAKGHQPMKENAQAYRTHDEFGARGGNYGNGGYGNSDGRNNMYKNEMEDYRNNQANFENQEEYVP